MSTRLLADSIALMETRQGKTAIGASGLITNLVDIVSKLPIELKDGLLKVSMERIIPEAKKPKTIEIK